MPLIWERLTEVTPDHHDSLMRPIGFVRRKEVNVGAKSPNVWQSMRGVTDTIDTNTHTGLVRETCYLGGVIDLANNV